jgi:hypothetical protein
MKETVKKSSETSVNFQQATWHCIPEDKSVYNHRCQNLIFSLIKLTVTAPTLIGVPLQHVKCYVEQNNRQRNDREARDRSMHRGGPLIQRIRRFSAVTQCQQNINKPTSNNTLNVRFEVFTAVTMKNAVFCDVTPCGFCKIWRFGETYRLHHQCDENRQTLVHGNKQPTHTAKTVHSSETSVLIRATRYNIPEDGILQQQFKVSGSTAVINITAFSQEQRQEVPPKRWYSPSRKSVSLREDLTTECLNRTNEIADCRWLFWKP